MKIGVDCSRLFEDTMTGTQNYLFNILRSLAELDDKNEYVLYFRKRPSKEFLQRLTLGRENWTFKVISSKFLWTQGRLAYETFLGKPDLLFCTWQTVPIVRYPKTQLVSVIHDFAYRKKNFWTTYASILLSSRVIFVSSSSKNIGIKKFKHFRNLSRKFITIGEGVDSSIFKNSSKEEIFHIRAKYSLNNKYVLCVGSIQERKNLKNVIRAHAMLLTTHSDIDLVFVGKKVKESDSILQLPVQLGTSKNFYYLDDVSNNELVSIYSGAEMLCYMSFDEGFGLPILEAFLCRCRVLASDIESNKETGKDFCVYKNPRSVEDIYSGMLELLNMSATHEGDDRAFKYAKSQSWDESAKKILHVFSHFK